MSAGYRHKCLGPPSGPGHVPCDREPVARTPYRSTFPQRPICLECAALWGNGSPPELVSPYSYRSEFHYTHPSERWADAERELDDAIGEPGQSIIR